MLDYPLLGLAVAILPLPVAYLLGWRLLRHADDPTFAEEWFRHRTNMAKLAVGAWVVASVLAGRWAAAWVVVAALSSWIGNFRSHQRLHNEAWSLGEFLVWRTRYALGVVTFWILLLAAPLLIAVYGREWALPLLVILVAWQIGHERILLRALDAQPIAGDALNMRFAAIVQKATCPEPRIVSIGPRRGFFANAFALPGTPRGSVLLTDTLLRCLEPDETAAIFAHEIAHLEEHTPRKTSRRRGQTSGWLVFGILVTWAVAGDSGSAALAFSIIWILLLIGPAMASRRRHAAHEAASDARAVELCGDAPALIRGLTKTHLLSRLPRRWDSAREARLTHPSLARRIQALRSKYGLAEDDEAPATEPFETLVLKSRKRAGEYFLLDRSGARWLEDVPRQTPENAETLASAARASQQIPFCDLTALHVRPTMTGPVLVLRLGANETQSFPMHHDDAAAVQAALDRLDVHLGAAPPEGATPLARAMPRIVTAFAFILSATAGSIPAMLAAVIAFVTPAPPTMAAAGAAAVVVALAALPGYNSSAGPDQRDLHLFALGVLGVFGIIALGLAFRSRGDRRPRRSTWVVIAIMLASALIGAFPLFVTRDALVVSLVARTRPSLVVSLAALTAALAFAPHRRARLASIFALLLLVATIYAATPSFARAYVVDPLVASHAPREVGPPTLLSSTVCDQSIDRVRLSPDGMHYVARVRSDDDPEGVHDAPFILGGRKGPPLALGEAREAGFLNDNLVAIYEVRNSQPRVRVTTLDGHDQSATPVPMLSEASLFTNAGEWTLFGRHGHSYLRLQSSSSMPAEWARLPVARTVADAGPRLAMVAWDAPPFVTSIAGAMSEVVLVRDGDKDYHAANTLLDARLQHIPGDGTRVLCFAPDASRTHVSLLDTATRRVTTLAWLPGVIAQAAVAPDLRTVMRTSFGDVVLFNPRKDVVSLVNPKEIDDPADIAIADHVVVVVQWTSHGSQIAFYSTSVVE